MKNTITLKDGLILTRSQLKAEISYKQFIREKHLQEYEKNKQQWLLQEIRYVEGHIRGLEEAIKFLTMRIESLDMEEK